MRTGRFTTRGAVAGAIGAAAVGAAALAPPAAVAGAGAGEHGTLGAGPARASTSVADLAPGPSSLAAPAWVFPASDPAVSGPIGWVLEAGPATAGRLAIAAAADPPALWAIDRETGDAAWSAPTPAPVLDSWSTPTVDRRNGTVLHATGRSGTAGGVVRAVRLVDGSLAWEAELERDSVNATPLVTTDRGPADRAFVTDYEGFYQGGTGAKLYCINVDPFDAALNPFDPGEIVWSAPLFDGASGSTPAYDGSRVYVGTAGNANFGVGGSVIAFDPGATTAAAAELWRTDLGGDDGVFGGVSVSGGAVFAATYDFFGGTESARLLRLDAAGGAVLWSAPTNRTASIPVPLPGGRVLLSTGVPGFGSVPTLRVYDDLGTSASLAADSAAATWNDDGDGLLEPGEFDVLGGWTHQPHVVLDHPLTGGPVALVGSIDDGTGGGLFAGYTRLSLIDLSVPFGSPGWVLSVHVGAGSSPAVAGTNVYTVGAAGVVALGAYCPGDADLSGAADAFDLFAVLRRVGADDPAADLTLDGAVDAADINEQLARLAGGCP